MATRSMQCCGNAVPVHGSAPPLRSSSNSTAAHQPHCNRRAPDTRACTHAHMHTHCQRTRKASSLSSTSRPMLSRTLISMCIEPSLREDLQISNSHITSLPNLSMALCPAHHHRAPLHLPGSQLLGLRESSCGLCRARAAV
jgi:hypothetical protein